MIIPHYENTLRVKCSHRDIFGIGSATGAVAGMANTAMTNQTNKEIADEANKTQIKIHEDDRAFNAEEAEKAREFNAEEAEKSRQFNSEEAQKAREWNSEPEVMKRRAEAGLNTAVTGQTTSSGGGSSAQASSSPAVGGSASAPSAPHLAVPTMQPIDMGSIMQGISSLAKTQSEVDKNNAGAKDLIANAEHKAELAEYQRIVNEWTPNQFRSSIAELTSKTNLNKAEIRMKDAQVEGFQAQMDKFFQEGYALYISTNLQVADFNQQVNEYLASFPLAYETLQQDAQKFEAEWKRSGYDMAYKWGSKKESHKGWDVGLRGNAHRGRSGENTEVNKEGKEDSSVFNIGMEHVGEKSTTQKVLETVTKAVGGIGIQVEGGYRDSDIVRSNYRNEPLYKYFVEGQALANIARSPKYSKEIQDKALQRMNTLSMSVEGYGAFLMQLGKVKRFPKTLEQDFEDQQD